MARNDGLRDPRLGKRILAETRLRRYEVRVERAIKSALAQQQVRALSVIKAQTLTAAAPPDPFDLAAWDAAVTDEVLPVIGDVLNDIAAKVTNFLALPPETRAQILGRIDLAARADSFVSKVSRIGPNIASRLIEEMTIGVGKGESIDTLTDRLTTCFNIGENDAARIARTETHGAAEATTHDSATAISSAGFTVTKSWLATADPRTRESHTQAEIDNQEIPIDQPFRVGDEDLMYPGDPDGSPEETINCRAVLEGTRVIADGLVAVTRLAAKEEIVRITTAGDKLLAASPEHRVMTVRGWIRADALVPGDYLVCYPFRGGAGGSSPDVADVPAKIEEVWDSVALAAARRKGIGPGGMNLYGRCPHGDVDVVRTGDDLSLGLVSTGTQHADDFNLTNSHAQVSPSCDDSSLGRIDESHAIRVATGAGVESSRDDVPPNMNTSDVELLRDAELGVTLLEHVDNEGGCNSSLSKGSVGVTSSPLGHLRDPDGVGSHQAPLFQDGGPFAVADTSFIASLLGVEPTQIELDRVLDTSVEIGQMQLFDLSTTLGWYVANEIVVHNCSVIYDMPTDRDTPPDDYEGMDAEPDHGPVDDADLPPSDYGGI